MEELLSSADSAAALRELEAAGYFVRRSPSSGGDSFSGTVYERSARPLLEPLPPRRGAEGDGEDRRSAEKREDAEAAAAERVLARLNELRRASWVWARYTPLSSRHAKNVEHIKGRLREGYREEDLVLVLEYLAATDGGKDDSRRFFDSVTPFNTKNFERNLAMAREWEARGRPTAEGPLALQRSDGHDPTIYDRRANREAGQ